MFVVCVGHMCFGNGRMCWQCVLVVGIGSQYLWNVLVVGIGIRRFGSRHIGCRWWQWVLVVGICNLYFLQVFVHVCAVGVGSGY